MNKALTLFSACILSTTAVSTWAEEPKTLTGDAELGWTSTSGNTVTSNTKAKLSLTHNTEKWRHSYTLEGYGSQSEVTSVDPVSGDELKETQTSSEKYAASMRNELKINNDHASLFVSSSYEDDRFSGFDYQASIAAGYANRLYNTERSHFDYRVGPGYAIAVEQAADDNGTNDTKETFIVRIELEYFRQLSESAKFTQTLSSDLAGDSEKNTRTKSVTAITANINNAFALKAAYTIDYNDIIPQDKKHANSQSSITLVYSF